MTFAMDQPKSNSESNQSTEPEGTESNQFELESQIIRTRIEQALSTLDRTQGRHTAVSVSNEAKVSDTAVRKAFKAIKQVLPEEILVQGSRYTELSRSLMLAYFKRPDWMNGATWINELESVAGALPDPSISSPALDASKYWEERQQELGQESSALALRSESLLAYVREQSDLDDLGDEEAFEAELEALRERSYNREVRRQVAVIEGRNQARQDLRQNP